LSIKKAETQWWQSQGTQDEDGASATLRIVMPPAVCLVPDDLVTVVLEELADGGVVPEGLEEDQMGRPLVALEALVRRWIPTVYCPWEPGPQESSRVSVKL
jgi:hypothetical protein